MKSRPPAAIVLTDAERSELLNLKAPTRYLRAMLRVTERRQPEPKGAIINSRTLRSTRESGIHTDAYATSAKYAAWLSGKP